MNEGPECYVLDANAFIEAKKRFYTFEICPGYWDALIWHHRDGRLYSIDKVRDEIAKKEDDLREWAEKDFRMAFCDTADTAVTSAYSQMANWVMAQDRFHESARMEFLGVADGWLAAFARVRGLVLVTFEVSRPESRSKVSLPDVCNAFNVLWINPFEMLRRLKIKLTWQRSS